MSNGDPNVDREIRDIIEQRNRDTQASLLCGVVFTLCIVVPLLKWLNAF